MSAPRSYSPFPGPLFTGNALLVCTAMVPARKIRSACLRFLPGHWALSMQNLILLRFTDTPGFAEPTPPVRILTGGPRASPTQFRKVFLRTVGEGLKVNRPKAERSHLGVCPSRGPASVQPLRKQRGRDHIRRRGGPCGRLYSRCESWRAHAMRPYWFPVDCRGGPVWPPASEISASCRTRSPGHAVPPMAGRPRGSPLRVKQNISGRAGEGTRPYGENRTVAVGSAEPGAVVEPQQRQFLQTQGPVARME